MATIPDMIDTVTLPRRLRLGVTGAVQGAGFRPFVFRLARSLNLSGYVRNTPTGVTLEIEGSPKSLSEFQFRLRADAPNLARVDGVNSQTLPPTGSSSFEIRESESDGEPVAVVLPDIATCADCLRELLDPADRRYRYPFINCTQCGPRYSIIESLPYDRPNTSMRRFRMCPACQSEYDDPTNRRFHAQPNACACCGPHIEFWNADGSMILTHDRALLAAADAVRAGQIVAMKGIGGFHLLVDARDDEAVARLRERKHREAKPLAVMMPAIDTAAVYCELSALEQSPLVSTAAPIVLARLTAKRISSGPRISESVAPGNPYLGIMLPYSPLHHLLMRELGFPIVATSGNHSDEPICTDEHEAVDRLRGIADCFLVHNRPIVRHVDDSVVRVAAGREMILRRARGYAPMPIDVDSDGPPVLAVGAHLKNSVALTIGGRAFISQHMGDLETPEACDAFQRTTAALQTLYEAQPAIVACDLHPDYVSSQFAARLSPAPIRVQHHHAHIAACMAEHGLRGEVLGVCWDGTGFGPDGTIWGGEFLRATTRTFRRVAHLKPFALPGASRAVLEPRRSAIALLYETYGAVAMDMEDLPPIRAFAPNELNTLRRMLESGLNSPRSSSMGRLFDAVAALLDLRQTAQFEGQAAMDLEFASVNSVDCPAYSIEVSQSEARVIDWTPMIREIVIDVRNGVPCSQIGARFHRALSDLIVRIAQHESLDRVVLSGGCFQNMLLLENVAKRLRAARFTPVWPRQVPPNDGGIALGQAVVARTVAAENTTAPFARTQEAR